MQWNCIFPRNQSLLYKQKLHLQCISGDSGFVVLLQEPWNQFHLEQGEALTVLPTIVVVLPSAVHSTKRSVSPTDTSLTEALGWLKGDEVQRGVRTQVRAVSRSQQNSSVQCQLNPQRSLCLCEDIVNVSYLKC